ncbi:MAG: hypothetical protein ACYDBH_03055 [Acidobacteriaceae bacterium]
MKSNNSEVNMDKSEEIPTDKACPFCKATLASGATVCASCGATWTFSTNGGIAMAGLIGVVLLFMAFVSFHSGDTHTWGPAGIFTIVGGLLFWFAGKAANKHAWVRKQ